MQLGNCPDLQCRRAALFTFAWRGAVAINKKRIILWGIGVALALVGCFAGYTWIALHWSYSRGERVGYVIKLSEKGWLVPTFEGELALLPVPGTVPEKFLFSVPDKEVAERINKLSGKRVALVYQQHKGVPTKFFGETEYFVIDVRGAE
jgi:hypothetical protein